MCLVRGNSPNIRLWLFLLPTGVDTLQSRGLCRTDLYFLSLRSCECSLIYLLAPSRWAVASQRNCTQSLLLLHNVLGHAVVEKTPWSESARELYRPSDRRLSAKWLPTCADRRCYLVSVTDPSGHISRFSRQGPLLFYQVAPQLYSRGWVHSVPDPLLFFFW
jgi:hypothetical protein